MTLITRQIEQFQSEGYLLIEDALAPADLAPVIDEYAAYIDRRAHELLAEERISQLYADAPFERRLACICREDAELYRELDIMHLRGRASFEFLRNPALLDIVESLVGPEITCSPIQHIRPKLPNGLAPRGSDPHVAPWHQDAGVAWAEADPYFILTVWLPLTAATAENGCLQVLPGGHVNGILRHHTRRGTGTKIVGAELPRVHPVTLPMRPGALLLMHNHLPHRSTKNQTDTVRWSADLRYQTTDTPPGRPYHPAFVARSRAHPAAELTDYDAWCEMWRNALAESQGIRPHRWGNM
ncbi:MAG: phytanoyl-CoA dioxygenase family protein [Caldilineaceae bacterium]